MNLLKRSALLLAAFAALCALPSVVMAQVVAFGASQVAGLGVDQSQAYPAQLEAMLRARGYNVTVANAGVSGATTTDMLNRVDSVAQPGAKVVILDTSGCFLNDYRHGISRAQGKADIATITALLRARGIVVIDESTADIALNLRQADGLHLTPEGHRFVAERLLDPVIRALRKAR